MSPLSPSPQLRKALRQARRDLPRRIRLQNERSICARLSRLYLVNKSRRIASYLSADGEVDLTGLHHSSIGHRVQFLLPVLRKTGPNRLFFSLYLPGEPLLNNRFGIPEPDLHHSPPVSLRSIDLVLMPLVGFDAELNRMGMGGGFYDRTFAFLQRAGEWRRPRLVGVAHECQRVAALDKRPWDVPLDMVVTESGIYGIKSANY